MVGINKQKNMNRDCYRSLESYFLIFLFVLNTMLISLINLYFSQGKGSAQTTVYLKIGILNSMS